MLSNKTNVTLYKSLSDQMVSGHIVRSDLVCDVVSGMVWS